MRDAVPATVAALLPEAAWSASLVVSCSRACLTSFWRAALRIRMIGARALRKRGAPMGAFQMGGRMYICVQNCSGTESVVVSPPKSPSLLEP